jgi:hypothetical protein
MSWSKVEGYLNVYAISEVFNGFQYNVVMTLGESDKTVKYWVSISSGKKRKDFEVFEEKANKSFGGLKALFWIKSAVFSFSEFFKPRLNGRQEYICVGWADARRRDIYENYLKREGFTFAMEFGNKILMKKL